MTDAAPVRLDPDRIAVRVMLGALLVGLGCAGVTALAVALFGGGTRLALVAQWTTLLGLGGGELAAFAIVRFDLFPLANRLAGAALRDGGDSAEQVGALAVRLAAYPRRLGRKIALALLGVLPAAALAASWLAGDPWRWSLPLLPAALLAAPLAAAAIHFTTRRALRRVAVALPPPATAAAFSGSLSGVLPIMLGLPAVLVALVGLLFGVLDGERADHDAWRAALARGAVRLAAGTAGHAPAIGARVDATRPGAGRVVSCIQPLGPVAVAACDAALGAGAGQAGSWLDAADRTVFAAALVAPGADGAPGAAVLWAPLAPPAGPAPWVLAALLALLGGTCAAGAFLGRRLGRALRAVAGTIERGGDGTTGAREAPPFVREVERLAEAAARLAERTAALRCDEEAALEALEDAQRVRTQFLASVSHDLKGPLNAVLGFSELLLRGVEGPLASKQRDDVRLVHRAGEDLLGIINSILDAARLEAGRVELSREWTPSVELISEAVRQVRPLLANKDVTLQTKLQAGLPPVHVDPHRIGQALQALVSNAVKFTEHGAVTVRAFVERGDDAQRVLRVDVRDSGPGIADEDRGRIFRAFEQVEHATQRTQGGPGLGLFLAKSMIELHGGRLWFESMPGKGSIFSFALPLPEDRPATPPPA